MKKTLFIALSILAVAACTQSKKTTVIGKFAPEAADSVMVSVEELGIDTVLQIKEGQVKMELPVNKAVAGMMGSYTYYPVNFVLDGTTVTIDFTAAPNGLEVAPKSVNAGLKEVMDWEKGLETRYGYKVDEIKADSTLDEAASAAAIAAVRDSIIKESIDGYKKYFDGNKDNYVGIYALRALGNYDIDKDLETMLNQLVNPAKETKIAGTMREHLETVSATAEGRMFKDFTVEQEPGNTVKLSDYVGKGKYVLVDFWASWCGPCRREIPNIKAVYEKFHGDKFDVLSVAVWDEPEDTKKALEEEGLKWPQIINAQKEPAAIYGIQGIPHIILFGPDGTILKRGLRGEQIEAAIAEYIK